MIVTVAPPAASAPQPCAGADLAYAFDDYLLVPASGRLFRGGVAHVLKGRECEVLLALVKAAGTVVTRQQLFEQVWGAREVADTNLRVQIARLRRLLAEDGGTRRYIDSIAGQGYCFVAPVVQRHLAAGERASATAAADSADATLAPAPPLLGRDDACEALVGLLRTQRRVTLCGGGGVGKSALAHAAIERLGSGRWRHARLIDLSTRAGIDAAGQLRTAAASDWPEAGQRPRLIVLDHCEFDLDLAAAVVDAITAAAPRTMLLAVSRVALQTARETLYRLAPLEVAPAHAALSLAEARQVPAIALFCAHALRSDPRFRVGEADVADLVALCRALDGLPLAIELAARQTSLLTLSELRRQYQVHTAPERAWARPALARHQSMWDSLDWSYRRLAAIERQALCVLARFNHSVGLSCVCAALDDAGIAAPLRLAAMRALVANALVVAEQTGSVTVYGMLNTTRAFARARQRWAADAAPLGAPHTVKHGVNHSANHTATHTAAAPSPPHLARAA